MSLTSEMKPNTDLSLLRALVGKEEASIPELLEARCRISSGKTLLVFQEQQWTYGQAWEEIRRHAGFFNAVGAGGSEQRIAGYLSKCPQALWSWFGSQLTGAAFAMLNRQHRGDILIDMLRRTRAGMLVTEAAAWSEFDGLDQTNVHSILFIDYVPENCDQKKWKVYTLEDVASAAPSDPVIILPDAVGTLMFTSGTTGRSKIVLQPHNMYTRGAVRFAESIGFTNNDIMHDWAPLYHITGQLHVTMTTIVAGGTLAMFDKFSRSKFWDQVASVGATCFMGLPNVIRYLLSEQGLSGEYDNSLRIGITGSSRLADVQAFERRFGIELINSYGMTEAEPLTLPILGRTPGDSCGKPCQDFEIAILDEFDIKKPVGETGRIAVRPTYPGMMMFRYEEDDAATVGAWRNLWFHTQDLGRFDDDGFLYYVDRIKNSIRRGGENISPVELETVVRQHEAIDDCAAVGVPDVDNEEEIKLVVKLSDGAVITPEQIHSFCQKNLARFMVPRYIEICSTLPYTEVGKVDKNQLLGVKNIWDSNTPNL